MPFLLCKHENLECIFAIKSNWINSKIKAEVKKYLRMKIIYLTDYDIATSLHCFDIGCHIVLDGPDNFSRLGIKVYEYLYSGLHVLASSSSGGAKQIASQHNALIELETLYTSPKHFLHKIIGCKTSRNNISTSFREVIDGEIIS